MQVLDLAEGPAKAPFNVLQTGLVDGPAGGQEQVAGRGKPVLAVPESFPQEALGPVAEDGVADPPGGDETGPAKGWLPVRGSQEMETKKSALPTNPGSAN